MEVQEIPGSYFWTNLIRRVSELLLVVRLRFGL